MGASVLNNGLQTIVAAANPTTNYDYQTAAPIRKPAGGGSVGECSWLLHFARPFPLGATIVTARIVLYSSSTAQTGSIGVSAQRLKTAVNFSRVTWNTRPTTYYAGVASVTKTGPIATRTEWAIDVTSMMQSVSLGEAWYGFRLSSTTINPALNFFGPTYGDMTLRPRLEVEWADEPDQPQKLSPSGGRAVSVEKPIVRCDYVDVSGSTEMMSIQVQTAATNSFAVPAWDSGTVAANVPELDLSLTSYPGLADGGSVWWRVRVQDAAGLWSDWSDGANFTRDVKGVVAITNPGADPNDFVTEPTPPITWTFTGETQAAYQLFISGVDAAGQVTSWTSGKLTSTVQTVTLPEGVLKTPDAVYTLTVRVWDAKQREGTPGDPAYAELSREFTYAFDALTAPVTATAAEHLAPFPKVEVTWSRSTDPDSFTIMRNRVVIASGLLPGNVRVSGTNFAWVDLSPSPKRDNVYEVVAVVNGKSSAGNPTDMINIETWGVWLADLTRTYDVAIVGKAERGFVYGESSEVLEPVGGGEIILVTMALRGLEGTITGQLQSGHQGLATTAAEWKAKLLQIKRMPGRRLWLTIGDLTIQVVIRNVYCSPRPTAQLAFDVSFDFYQVGPLEFAPSL